MRKSHMKKIDLSIIIISYNTKELTLKCLKSIYQSLKQSQLVYEIIVVDNNSIDGTTHTIRKEFPEVKLHSNPENLGYGKANNQGVDEAKGETVLILNSDIQVIDKGIERLYQFFVTLPEKSVAGGKLFNTDGAPQSSCGPAYTLSMIFIALFLKGDYLHWTRYSPDVIKQVDWLMGACLMFKKNAFSDVGRFDEGIFMYMEEIDWQHRAQKLKFKMYFYPDAHFTHVGAGSSKGRTTPILNVFRGFIYFYKKHYSYIPNIILRVILVCKSLLAIQLFAILSNKLDQKLYKEALKIAIS